MKVDVKELGADFFAFSGHKLFGPMESRLLRGEKNSAPLRVVLNNAVMY